MLVRITLLLGILVHAFTEKNVQHFVKLEFKTQLYCDRS